MSSLRGIAAACVLLNHVVLLFPPFADIEFKGGAAGTSFSENPLLWLLCWTPFHLSWDGPAAVRLFFVISGFVLALLFLKTPKPSYNRFLLRRVVRIWLPMAAAVTAGALLYLFVPAQPPGVFPGYWTAELTPASFANTILLIGDIHTYNFDAPTWSLVQEMRVSALMPILAAAFLRFPVKLATLLFLILFWSAPTFLRGIGVDPSHYDVGLTFEVSAMFALGYAIAVKRDRIASFLAGLGILGQTSFAAVSVVLFNAHWNFFHDSLPMTDTLNLLGAGGVVAAAFGIPWIRGPLLHPLPRFLGRISYSLYLVHFIAIGLCVRLLAAHMDSKLVMAAAVALSIVAATLLERHVERPCILLSRKLGAAPRAARGGSPSDS